MKNSIYRTPATLLPRNIMMQLSSVAQAVIRLTADDAGDGFWIGQRHGLQVETFNNPESSKYTYRFMI